MTHLSLLTRGGAIALAASFATLTACSDATGVGDRGTGSQLAFTTRAPSASGALANAIPVTKNGHTLDLTEVTVVVDRVSLKRERTDSCASDDDDDDNGRSSASVVRHSKNCGEVKAGPALVDLPLDGKLVTLPGNAIPEGTYREMDLRISLVRLRGTYDTKAFDVTVAVNAKSEIEFETPIVVQADSSVSITVNLPVDTWLANTDGSLVDPNTLLTSSTLMASVKNRIRASIRAFEDNDRDGREDHRHWIGKR